MFTPAAFRGLLAFALLFPIIASVPTSAPVTSGEETLSVRSESGEFGGVLTVAQRSEPKTLNPVLALDAPSREVIGRMNADLISTNRLSGRSDPALAKSWTASEDGRRYVLRLRQGLRFSDGHPFDADDVVFTFKVYLDQQVHSPQRDLLVLRDTPIQVRKLDAYTVGFELADSYATVERLFDGVVMLPRHLLEKAYLEGKLADAWSLSSKAGEIAGMGPFRFKEFRPGECVILERNPYYWKVDEHARRLPYLNEIEFIQAGSEDGQIARFLSGEADVVNRLSSKSFRLLQTSDRGKNEQLRDLGAGLEYTFLFFNFKQQRFQDAAFRRAVSAAIDRDAIARLAYDGRASILSGNVTPGNKQWRNTSLPAPVHSERTARELFRSAGYAWDGEGKLTDRAGQRVEFSIITAANNSERLQSATLIQYDLGQVGITVQVVPLEFHALVDRVTNTRQFEACILSLGGGDGDPNSELNVWLSKGKMHVWAPMQTRPATAWEAEIDDLMERQMAARDPAQRKQLYDRVQAIVAEQLPILPLVSPHILVAARKDVRNFNPAIVDHYTLWDADSLYKRSASERLTSERSSPERSSPERSSPERSSPEKVQ